MIKVAFSDFWSSFNEYSNSFIPVLNSLGIDYTVSDIREADYLFFSVFGYEHLKASEECVKIFYTGECLCPDFNLCDYAIGFDYLNFGDRYIRFPLYYLYDDINEKMEAKHKIIDEEAFLKSKKRFCSFTVSNPLGNHKRKDLFELVQTYRSVDSGGKWMNNIGHCVEDKYSFDSEHKFSIVCENSSHPGYTTEKIVQAFAAQTIPIYWGDPLIKDTFNSEAFINVSDYPSTSSLLEVIKAIDNDDRLYLSMIKAPALCSNEFTLSEQRKSLLSFLSYIFGQDIKRAKRMNRDLWGKRNLELLKTMKQSRNNQQSLMKHFLSCIASHIKFPS